MGKAAKVGAPNAQGRIAHGHGKDEEEAGNAVAFSQACEGSGVAGEGRGGASGVGGKGAMDDGQGALEHEHAKHQFNEDPGRAVKGSIDTHR